jgi:hypothetical protein
VKTIADQLKDKGLTWHGYMEDMGNSTAGQSKTCRHPAANSHDDTQTAKAGDQYAARHNPFVYFHSITDDAATCNANDVPLDRLPADLANAASTPNYVFITPNLCNDGHDAPCADGKPGGLVSANGFLEKWVPQITSSPAYADGGLLIVTFDEAVATGAGADASSCCNEPTGPNTPNNGGTTQGSGGGKVGAVLLSSFVVPGSETKTPYNHYSLLRSTEDIFGLAHLGYAARDDLKPFGSDIFANPTGEKSAIPPAPRLRVGVPHRCVHRRFTGRVSANAVTPRHVTASLDRKRLRSTGAAKFRVRASVRNLRAGNHRFTAFVTDRFGRRLRRTAVFSVCPRQ